MWYISESLAETAEDGTFRYIRMLGVENEMATFETPKAYRRRKEILEGSKD